MILLLVRHAVTSVTGTKLTGRLPGFDLSTEGIEQAEVLGGRFRGVPIKAIYSSPMERCQQTIGPVAKACGVVVSELKDVVEVNYGDWQGKSLKSLYRTKAWAQLRARPGDFRFPGGETIREAQTRGMNAIESIREKHKGQGVVVCSHADVIRLLVAGYLGLGIDLYNRISIAPASITALMLADSTPRLVRLGDVGDMSSLFKSKSAAKRNPKSKAKN